MLLAQGSETLLLGDGVDVGADDEGHQVEEGHPELVGEELLSEGQAQRGSDPADLHDLPESNLDGRADLVVRLGTGDEGHRGEVDGVLDGRNLRNLGQHAHLHGRFSLGHATYYQVADDNLQDLRAQAGAASKGLLQGPDEEVAEGRADEGAVGGHLRYTRGEVVAMLVAVLGEEGCNQLLGTGESTSSEHLGAQRVLLELLDVGLGCTASAYRPGISILPAMVLRAILSYRPHMTERSGGIGGIGERTAR